MRALSGPGVPVHPDLGSLKLIADDQYASLPHEGPFREAPVGNRSSAVRKQENQIPIAFPPDPSNHGSNGCGEHGVVPGEQIRDFHRQQTHSGDPLKPLLQHRLFPLRNRHPFGIGKAKPPDGITFRCEAQEAGSIPCAEVEHARSGCERRLPEGMESSSAYPPQG